jgi:hypothetical protein
VHLSNSISDEAGVLYLATHLTHGEATPEPTERLEVRWLPLDAALAMTFDGQITDALSIIGLQRVALARMAAQLAQAALAARAAATDDQTTGERT